MLPVNQAALPAAAGRPTAGQATHPGRSSSGVSRRCRPLNGPARSWLSTSTAGRGRGDRQVATSDAPVVAAVRAAGAIVIGKTRTDELGDVRAQLRATGRLTRLRGPVNTSGLVAMSVPSGTDEADHPIGVQLVATRMRVLDDAARRFSTP